MARTSVKRAGQLERRPALAGATASGKEVEVAVLPPAERMSLRAPGASLASLSKALGLTLPTKPKTSTSKGKRTALWLGPDEWLVFDDAGKDPLAFRLDYLGKAPRDAAVLRLAAEKAGWGQPLPAGKGRGIAVHESFRTHVAMAAEVTVDGACHEMLAASAGAARAKEAVRRARRHDTGRWGFCIWISMGSTGHATSAPPNLPKNFRRFLRSSGCQLPSPISMVASRSRMRANSQSYQSPRLLSPTFIGSAKCRSTAVRTRVSTARASSVSP